MAETTIFDFYRQEAARPRDDRYTHHFPGGSRSVSTGEFLQRAAAFAEGLTKLGVTRGDRVMLLCDNRPEWHMVDLAVLNLGAVDVPIYSTLTPEQIAYQVRDSGSVVAIADTPEQMGKFLEIWAACPDLKHLVQIDGERKEGVWGFDEVISSGDRPNAVERFWERADKVNEEDLATIIYTSGTTGEPKGVMLTHRNFVQNGLAIMDRLPTLGEDDVILEMLPLCHVFERCAGYVYMTRSQPRAYCATGDVGELIAKIAPSGFCVVPRILEKVHDGVLAKVRQAPGVRQRLFYWAIGVGRKVATHRLEGTTPGPILAAQHRLADKLVLSKVRGALGGKVRYAISGAAALARQVNEFFHSLGISIQEGYGLTETSPGVCFNGWRPKTNRLGSVGQALGNVEVKLADDGELLVRGPHVMKGYWNKPQETAEVIDDDGFFRTGDIARIDEDGFIYITDRKKELLVTAGGKNVAPQPIENQLKQSPYVENVVVLGDARPFVAALISPSFDALRPWAAARGIPTDDEAELVARPEVVELFDGIVAETNGQLARFEQIKQFKLIPAMFSIEGGQLTPTLKVKRRVIADQFAAEIAAVYERSERT